MKVRLADIAREAGVSEATVSRVLNDRPGVNAETRTEVQSIAARLGRGAAARPTASNLVGQVVPDVENPVFALYADRIEDELHRHGYGALTSMRARTPAQERTMLERMMSAGAEGVIVVSGFHANTGFPVSHYRELLDQGLKMVLINGPREELPATFISNDDTATMRLSLSHLRELGHRRVGLALGEETTYPVRAKSAAFRTLVPELLGSEGSGVVAFTMFSHEGGAQAAARLLDEGCTAIICGSDIMAIGAISLITRRGLSVPADVSVVGFDDTPLIQYTAPPLTSVRQPVRAIARAAVASLLGQVRGESDVARSDVVVGPELVVRSTTGAAPHLR